MKLRPVSSSVIRGCSNVYHSWEFEFNTAVWTFSTHDVSSKLGGPYISNLTLS